MTRMSQCQAGPCTRPRVAAETAAIRMTFPGPSGSGGRAGSLISGRMRGATTSAMNVSGTLTMKI